MGIYEIISYIIKKDLKSHVFGGRKHPPRRVVFVEHLLRRKKTPIGVLFFCGTPARAEIYEHVEIPAAFPGGKKVDKGDIRLKSGKKRINGLLSELSCHKFG